jgi:hypothetical protein
MLEIAATVELRIVADGRGARVSGPSEAVASFLIIFVLGVLVLEIKN